MISKINSQKEIFNNKKVCIVDNILNFEYAEKIQKEIIGSSIKYWDRYENPFEKKYTWRDKNELLPLTKSLFDNLHTKDFIDFLSNFTGYKLQEDKSKNWWGIHTFNNGDKLDIHVDAGRHPENNLKKIITLGIYLSYNWSKECGGNIEFWKGTNSSNNKAEIFNKTISIEPIFNRCVIFENNDYSWHGAPEPCICHENQKRIFVTCSYLTDIDDLIHKNNRKKAFFVKLPNEPHDSEKDKLRLLRADPNKYKSIYKI
jgi:Rps23 Pro-64 3,4-dihydroxylase Tpa1-like proline 4-hydroxylase